MQGRMRGYRGALLQNGGSGVTQTVQLDNGYLAFYKGADKKWHVARDARGVPITCETEALATSVARSRWRRINWRPR